MRARPRTLAGCLLGAWADANAALAPLLGGPMIPLVALYSLALVLMAASSRVLGTAAARGGAVFLVSELLVGPGAADVGFPGRPVAVTVTYIAARYLLVAAFARTDRESGEERPAGAPTAARTP